ncbi:hypothetical protein SVEN_3300 [Streptomyces venezuelae ATCC 10712]|uniref:Uncharacterized protein n=1 Tax=Streptomyces venezuelae (strain ATCC 10712 / CBS 650.69 / DSM 40230 / JCM 4526 / NBRC 13096 / PD 04745) TaxID=953739 RepID=F2RAA4_STRVP|nr:hypothetical protein vnz_16255 [Streptomyces venezuelae]CCA56586.1 hypothetical protein SVEN_3300 [Streptomyces venezuelae ATCC 10712]
MSDTEWADIAQRIVEAAGTAPPGDDLGCRWIAVRHADDHVHILATTVREDGRRPRLHDSGIRVGDACRQIDAGLDAGDLAGRETVTAVEEDAAGVEDDRLMVWANDRRRPLAPTSRSVPRRPAGRHPPVPACSPADR